MSILFQKVLIILKMNTVNHEGSIVGFLSEEGYFCGICPKRYPNLRMLNFHVRTHFADNFHICEFCGHNVRSVQKLVMHYLKHKEIERCEICGKCFVLKWNLTNHIMYHHLTDLICKVCGIEIYSKAGMTNHMKGHASEVNCTVCGKRFPGVFSLRAHAKRAHYSSDYECKECGKFFRTELGLERHVPVHSGEFKCNECGKAFRDNCEVRRHMRMVHCHGSKNHHCEVCT